MLERRRYRGAKEENMNEIATYYDSIAESYAQEWYSSTVMLESVKEFIKTIGEKEPRVLDLGCGPGCESRKLINEGASVVGVDISKKSIEIARKMNPKGLFYNIGYPDISSDLGLFDGIFACSSLVH